MKYMITETDPDWLSDFREYISHAYGIQVLGTEFDAEDGLDQKYHGVVTADSLVVSDTEQVCMDWLKAYTGNFDFYLSLKQQAVTKGRLSERQIQAVLKAMDREAQWHQKRTDDQANKIFTMTAPCSILLTKGIAREVANKAGLTKPFYVFDVLKVLDETPKAYKLVLKASGQRTSHCGACGLGLTNAESVAAGIGPICADRYGVGFGATALEELRVKLMTTREVETWIPKSCIKQRTEKEGG
jgi:hypothetical protein